MWLLFWLSLAALAYVYVGYPLLLRLIVALRGPRPIARRDITPTVSLVISAYNEAAVIEQKLANALELDYPKDRLEIAVVSDASDDGTDDIVRQFADRGVKLFRQPVRRGKTTGLNAVVPQLTGEMVVFSDANAMYQPDAVRKLVRNFADPEVGCVTGEARYVRSREAGTAEIGERKYWDYEIQQKRLETAIGSMVGGDGAIYAIRKHLWRTLPETAINDFLNPLQIVAAGWRGVYEPEAICYEETAGGVPSEYRRRVRIVGRSWRAVFQAFGVLNPFKTGLFAVKVLSHKMLRWWSGLFLSVIVLVLVAQMPAALAALRPGALAAVVIATAAAMLLRPTRRFVGFTVYFTVVSAASLVGVFNGTVGRISGTWQPPRQQPLPAGGDRRVAWLLMFVTGSVGLAIVAIEAPRETVESVFWASIAVLVYVYVAYPLLIGALSTVVRRPVRKAQVEPSVALLIVANDEAAVIDAKLQNSLSIDYPRHLFRIVVASDGSVDGTNEIVRSYVGDRVELVALPERRGKTAAINAAAAAIGDVDLIVFSDANVFLQPCAVRALIENLADPSIGAVSGDVILVGDRAALAWAEDLYYRYERWLQRTESSMGSIVGVDGALYALRRFLLVPQPADTILDDLAIPMAILQKGYRVVFEPRALAIEQGSQSAWEEFSRKSRVVAGAAQFLLRGQTQIQFREPQVLFSLLSHKVLRWLSPGFAVMTLACSVALASGSAWYSAAAVIQGSVLAIGLAGCAPRLRRFGPVGLAHYCCLVQAAAAVGFARGLRGTQPHAWERFARASVDSPAPARAAARTETAL